jgi:hypothetical protein
MYPAPGAVTSVPVDEPHTVIVSVEEYVAGAADVRLTKDAAVQVTEVPTVAGTGTAT